VEEIAAPGEDSFPPPTSSPRRARRASRWGTVAVRSGMARRRAAFCSPSRVPAGRSVRNGRAPRWNRVDNADW